MGGLSMGYEMVGLLIFTVCAVLPLVPPIWHGGRWIRRRLSGARTPGARRILWTGALAAAVYAAVVWDAYVVEPNHPVLTRIRVEGSVDAPLRILHLSDLHIERTAQPRDAWLLDQVSQLKPDLILLTGDTHQLDNDDPATLRPVLSRLTAPLGVYGCVGADDTRLLQEAAPHITHLINDTRTVVHAGHRIGIGGLIGVGNRAPVYEAMRDADMRIVLNHTPDLADEAAGAGMSLFLCGHTHGGQVRIPFWGAIITNSATGKKYEAGRYNVGRMVAYTSRGFGLEPRPAPQVRFLCRPEITLIEVVPNS